MDLRARRVIGLLVVATGMLCIARPAEAEQEDPARQHFERGRALEEQGDLAGALAELQQAMELRPTFRLHRYMGRVCRGMGRLRESLDHYQTFLRDGHGVLDRDEQQEAETAVTELLGQLARLTVTTADGAQVLVDGTPVGTAPLAEPVRLDPGPHNIEVRLEGHGEVRRQVTMVQGEALTVELTPEPLGTADRPPDAANVEPRVEPERVGSEVATDLRLVSVAGETQDRRRVHRAWFWSMLSTSVSLLLTGGVTGVVALLAQDECDSLNRTDRNDDEDQRLIEARDAVEVMAPTTDVLLGVGAATAVVALVLAFFTDFHGDAGVQLVPSASADSAALVLAGGF